MERLLELLGNAVQFAYICWDRIVLNGYIEQLQRPENLIYFFHEIVGVDAIEPAVLGRMHQRLQGLGTTDGGGARDPCPRCAASAAQGRAQGGLRRTLLPSPERG